MASIVDLQFVADTGALDSATDKLKDLTSGIPGAGKAIDMLGNSFAALANPLTAAAAGAVLFTGALAALGLQMGFKYAGIIDDLGDLGDKYGYNASQIALMRRAAEDAGGSLEDAMKTYQKVATTMTEGADSTSKVGEAYKRLGVDVSDSSKTAEQATAELITKWEEGGQTAQDYSDMVKVMGKSFLDTIQSTKAAQEAQERYNEFAAKGIIITQEATDAAGDYEKAQADVAYIQDVMGSEMVATVIPAFTELSNWFVKSYENGGLVKVAFEGIKLAADIVVGAIEGLLIVFIGLDTTLQIAGKSIGLFFAAVEQGFKGNWAGVKDAFKEMAVEADRLANAGADAIARIKKDNDTKTAPGAGSGRFNNAGDGSADSAADTKKIKDKQEILTLEQQANQSLARYIEQQYVSNNLDAEKSEYSKALAMLQTSQYINASAQVKEMVLDQARMTDARKAAEEATKQQAEAEKKLSDEVKRRAEAQERLDQRQRQNTEKSIQQAEVAFEKQQAQFELTQEQRMMTNDELRESNMYFEEEYRLKEQIAQLDIESTNYAENKAKLEAASVAVLEKRRQLLEQQKALEDDWMVGAENAWGKYIRSVETTAQATEQIFTKAFKGMEDALVNFVQTGKLDFSSLANSIIADIIRIQIRQLASGIFKAGSAGTSTSSGDSGGGFGGLVMSFLGSLFANGGAFSGGTQYFADGGVVSSATTFGMAGGKQGVMGEAGPEAIMPLTRLPGGKLGVQAVGGAGGNSIVNQITVNVEGGKDPQQTGQIVADTVIRALAQDEIRRAKRSGGLLNPMSG